MINKLLIANRGEIAVRIIRTCKEMGIKTVAVYSTADKGGLHTHLADESVCIGPPASRDSYLSQSNLIAAALKTKCGAVHPGVGFLSENAGFARSVRQEGLVFIGPSPEVIEMLGDKVKARAAAVKFGLPVTPGTQDAVLDNALEAVKGIGFPVIIKAAAGGGGKGMRIVRREADLEENIRIARSESLANFGDERVFIERYVENPRHVELQILADGKGKVAVLGERDCSVQKNHQKLIEESPSPGVTDAMRDHMKTGAVNMFRELGYCGAGTIEFLVEGGVFYFMEVNARVQVEHPVSEFVSGVDIIRQQIFACTENTLEIDGADVGGADGVRLSGWAIECRINALSPGRVTKLTVPGGIGVRFDTFLSEGCFVPPYYDSMVGKLIVHAANRQQTLAKMERALSELVIEGIRTNRTQQEYIIKDKTFRSGVFDTSYYGSIAKEVEYV
ncbi:MAG: ATP-grasp domain-containing protein [Treponema sp.]|jgi:acetyl-CoA carboxylase biotin carboxylase subunit|nr:ATP-grasp domain-containing protein [Treponema sp.]